MRFFAHGVSAANARRKKRCQAKLAQLTGDPVTISAGQIVKWVNRDTFEHTVTFNAPDAAYLSGALSPKGELAIRFDQPGTYPYHCLPHPTMRGVVVVH